jgi:transposase
MTTQTAGVDFSARNLLVGIELSSTEWKLSITDKDLSKVSEVNVKPGDQTKLLAGIARAKEKLGLPPDAPVVSCYEAGRDGFWVHRLLTSLNVVNLVVDSSSILVERRLRRAKTDGLDARQLAELLARLVTSGGKAKVAKIVRVPTIDEEDARRLHRERERLVMERGAHQVRVKALLALSGTQVKDARKGKMTDLRQWDGTPLPPELRGELEREQQRLLLVDEQIREIEKERDQRLRPPKASKKQAEESASLTSAQKKGIEIARMLGTLLGIGDISAWLLAHELLWREYENRRQVASATGLVPTPYNSGGSTREQGISKAGNPLLRKVLIELAWSWLRFQPQSKLAKWFQERFGNGGSRSRRIGIVAVARRLVVDLWRFVKYGVIPDGAALRKQVA